MTMTPRRYQQFADLMESRGTAFLRDMLTDNPDQFWSLAGHFADRQWEPLSDADLETINERFVAFLRERARLRSRMLH